MSDIESTQSARELAEELIEHVQAGEGEDMQKMVKDELSRLEETVREMEKNMVEYRARAAEFEEPLEDKLPTFEGETLYTARVQETKEKLNEVLAEYTARAEENIALMMTIIDSRERASQELKALFDNLFTDVDNNQREIERRTKAQAEDPHDAELKKAQATINEQLEAIKRKSCIFFGCVDVHPPKLHNL